MTDEIRLHADMARGARAAALLDDDLLKEAFANLEASYIGHWKDSKTLDTAGREKLWQAVQIVGKVRSHLLAVAADGAMAAAELRELTA